jgi:hypothetical protein
MMLERLHVAVGTNQRFHASQKRGRRDAVDLQQLRPGAYMCIGSKVMGDENPATDDPHTKRESRRVDL